MKRPYRYAYNALKKMGVPVFIHRDDENTFDISAEDINSEMWVSYWSPQPHWIFGVNPMVEQILRHWGLHAEWINPGHLRVYE
jgi:hypothetical protein